MIDEPVQPAPPAGSEPAPAGSWWKLQGVFFEPTATFEAIRRRPNWLVPLAVMTFTGMLFWTLVMNVAGVENLLRTQFEQSGGARRMSEEQMEELIDRLADSTLVKVQFYGLGLIMPILACLAVAGLCMLGLVLAGGEVRFAQVFSVVCHAFFVVSIVTTALSTLVLLLMTDPGRFNIQNPVATNLAFLASPRETPVLYSFLSSLDLISFYAIYLMGLGLSTGTRASFAAATGMVVGYWGVYVAIFKVGLPYLFSG